MSLGDSCLQAGDGCFELSPAIANQLASVSIVDSILKAGDRPNHFLKSRKQAFTVFFMLLVPEDSDESSGKIEFRVQKISQRPVCCGLQLGNFGSKIVGLVACILVHPRIPTSIVALAMQRCFSSVAPDFRGWAVFSLLADPPHRSHRSDSRPGTTLLEHRSRCSFPYVLGKLSLLNDQEQLVDSRGALVNRPAVFDRDRPILRTRMVKCGGIR